MNALHTKHPHISAPVMIVLLLFKDTRKSVRASQ